MAEATQQEREFAVSCPLGEDVLLFYRMEGAEHLGRPFEFRLDMLSSTPAIDFTEILGQPLTVRVDLPGGQERHFSGIVAEFSQGGMLGDYHHYMATLRPWFWLLTRTQNCRIFQQQTVPEIIAAILSERGLTDYTNSLSGDYRKWDYCVQYRESDFAFLSRLMEQEGIYYYFKHEIGKHTLVLSDGAGSHGPFPGYATIPWYPPDAHEERERQHLFEWSAAQEVQTGKLALTDFDFERPRAEMLASSLVRRTHAHGALEAFDYPGEYVQKADGDKYAAVRLQQRQSLFETARGAGVARGVAAGSLFTLDLFPREDQNREYLVVSSEYELQSQAYEALGPASSSPPFHCRLVAIPSAQQYRSPAATPLPVIRGPQTAVVVGPSNQEIWCDKYGRVKVQFHWDRYGEKNENSSCWIRVAQTWAGKQWGGVSIPRIGQEVIVEFLEGDPDRPIITGRVYNADQMPPYVLPDKQTQTVFKTRSTKDGTDKTFNELRFEDLKDSEEIYFHAEKDFNRVVENNDTLKVGFDKKDKGDRTVQIFNNDALTVGNKDSADGSQTVTVWKDRTVTLETGNDTQQIKQGDRLVQLDEGGDTHHIKQGHREVKIDQGHDTLTITQGNQTIKLDAGKCTIEAAQSIELKVGGSSIKLTPTGITLKSTMITIEGQGMVQAKGGVATIKGSSMLELSAAVVKIN